MNYHDKIIQEIKLALDSVKEKDANNLTESVLKSKRIFVTGQGRSGFMIKSFAMRLMHIGFEVYVLGETITPSIGEGDLLIIASGSGETSSLIEMSEKVGNIGVQVALITADRESSIAKNSNVIVEIEAQTKSEQSQISVQPMGSLFEQALLIFCDGIILKLMEKTEKDGAKMFARHANLE